MTFNELVEIVADEPLFETGLLLAGAVDPADLRRQLSRWTRTVAGTKPRPRVTCKPASSGRFNAPGNDVRPFLERLDETALVTKENTLRLLARPRTPNA